jgi:hypothetical protein
MLDSVPWNTKAKRALSYWHDLVLNIYVFTKILITLYFINVTYDVYLYFPIDYTASTEPQCLYKGALYFELMMWIFLAQRYSMYITSNDGHLKAGACWMIKKIMVIFTCMFNNV